MTGLAKGLIRLSNMRPSGASLNRRKMTEKRILKLIVLLRYPTKELYTFHP